MEALIQSSTVLRPVALGSGSGKPQDPRRALGRPARPARQVVTVAKYKHSEPGREFSAWGTRYSPNVFTAAGPIESICVQLIGRRRRLTTRHGMGLVPSSFRSG